MPDGQNKPDLAMALAERAIRQGRHSATVRTMCDVCREWVDGIYHVTLDKKRVCRGCAIKIGALKVCYVCDRPLTVSPVRDAAGDRHPQCQPRKEGR